MLTLLSVLLSDWISSCSISQRPASEWAAHTLTQQACGLTLPWHSLKKCSRNTACLHTRRPPLRATLSAQTDVKLSDFTYSWNQTSILILMWACIWELDFSLAVLIDEFSCLFYEACFYDNLWIKKQVSSEWKGLFQFCWCFFVDCTEALTHYTLTVFD